LKPLILRSRVVKGRGLGRRLGFPTANLRVASRFLPPFGVYRVLVRGPLMGPGRLAVCNVGTRPTVGGGRVSVEVHIPGFSGDLYGRRLRVAFLERIRMERKFPSLKALKARIRRDVQAASGSERLAPRR